MSYATQTVSVTADSTTSVELAAAAPTRTAFKVTNNSSSTMLVAHSTTVNRRTAIAIVEPWKTWTAPDPVSKGAFNALWLFDAGGTAEVVESATATSVSDTAITDVGGYFTTDTVEAALQQLGLQTAIAPIAIVPPGCTVVVPAAAVWFGSNQTLGCKFTVPVRGTYRYVNWLVGVQSGNVQVCVVKFTSGLAYTRVMNSGIIACPAAGAVKTDLGSTVLDAGDYALCFWADNTTVSLGHSNAGNAWTAAEMSTAFSTPAGAIPASGTATYSGRILHAFVLSQT